MQRFSEVAFCTRDRRRQSIYKISKKKKGGGSVIRAIFLAQNSVSEQYAY